MWRNLPHPSICNNIYSKRQIEIHPPILAELNLELSTKLEERNIRIVVINEEIVEAISKLEFSNSFSYADTTLLTIAFNEKYTLLSGEGLMRKWGFKNNVSVHGIIYILNEMVVRQKLSGDHIAQCLVNLQEYNFWLPTQACLDYINKWRKRY